MDERNLNLMKTVTQCQTCQKCELQHQFNSELKFCFFASECVEKNFPHFKAKQSQDCFNFCPGARGTRGCEVTLFLRNTRVVGDAS